MLTLVHYYSFTESLFHCQYAFAVQIAFCHFVCSLQLAGLHFKCQCTGKFYLADFSGIIKYTSKGLTVTIVYM